MRTPLATKIGTTIATKIPLRRRGLTLVEVLLAVAILSMGLTVLLTAVSRCLVVMRNAKKYQTAQWTLGRGELENPLVVSNDVDELEVREVVYPNGMTYSRELDEDDKERKDGLHVVHTKVTWSDKGKEMREEVIQYVFHPKEKR
jgi:prepilin-type N-terminal cleavage/methylation domain-containing protein